MIDCYSPTIPTAKKYKKTQFSTTKKRAGKESVPLFGLTSGTHTVRFYNDDQEAVLNVKVWLSLYGWAWRITGGTSNE